MHVSPAFYDTIHVTQDRANVHPNAQSSHRIAYIYTATITRLVATARKIFVSAFRYKVMTPRNKRLTRVTSRHKCVQCWACQSLREPHAVATAYVSFLKLNFK
jgi:hypothetical protein